MSEQTKKETRRSLQACHGEYRQIKARILKLGFICEGSLVERRIPCGNKTCSCHKDPDKLHGPYHQLTWKEKGKTVTRLLSASDVKFYREWIENRRALSAIIDDMYEISRVAKNLALPKKKQDNNH